METLVGLVVWAVGVVVRTPELLAAFIVLGLVGSLIPGKKLTPLGLRSRYGWAANPVIALMAAVGLTAYVYRNRRSAGRGILAVVCAVAVLVWVVAVSRSPHGWRPWIVVGSFVGLVWLACGPLAREIGDRPLRVWVADRWLGQRVGHAAETVLEGTRVTSTATRPDGALVAHVQLPAAGRVDQLNREALASSLALEGLPVGVDHVDVQPGKAGQATLVVLPSPARPVWDVLRSIDNRWPGPVSDDPHQPIPLGPCVYPDGTVGVVSVPAGFPHVLVAGATGAGKSAGFVPLIGGLAHKRHTQLVLIDPLSVEFAPWEPRAYRLARGQVESYQTLQWVLQLMDERQRVMNERGKRKWRVGKDGPRVVVVVDELAAITAPKSIVNPPRDAKGQPMTASKVADLNADAIGQIASQARKWEIWMIAATQRSDAKYFEDGSVRDNFGFRIAYAHESGRGAHMVLGEGDSVPDPTRVPLDCKGGCYVRVDRGVYVAARPYFVTPRQHVSDPDEQITVAAEEIAAATAHLRDERLTYQLEAV